MCETPAYGPCTICGMAAMRNLMPGGDELCDKCVKEKMDDYITLSGDRDCGGCGRGDFRRIDSAVCGPGGETIIYLDANGTEIERSMRYAWAY